LAINLDECYAGKFPGYRVTSSEHVLPPVSICRLIDRIVYKRLDLLIVLEPEKNVLHQLAIPGDSLDILKILKGQVFQDQAPGNEGEAQRKNTIRGSVYPEELSMRDDKNATTLRFGCCPIRKRQQSRAL